MFSEEDSVQATSQSLEHVERARDSPDEMRTQLMDALWRRLANLEGEDMARADAYMIKLLQWLGTQFEQVTSVWSPADLKRLDALLNELESDNADHIDTMKRIAVLTVDAMPPGSPLAEPLRAITRQDLKKALAQAPVRRGAVAQKVPQVRNSMREAREILRRILERHRQDDNTNE
ncbi:hypothetical protein [Paraburkholderia sp. BL25I1N1]|uniref:hypothetical protein n=1 Tax=Paraburkholderia sp. BL25I1N1 TaxID=1938804 RepID=UPI000D04A36F|nr:hypothetical protein [Paraburkholderia sp. BL25I1N1]PRY03406.1 hypothetical protein B0G73_11510 [Paraburkholderia sp. BL25I1N1]